MIKCVGEIIDTNCDAFNRISYAAVRANENKESVNAKSDEMKALEETIAKATSNLDAVNAEANYLTNILDTARTRKRKLDEMSTATSEVSLEQTRRLKLDYLKNGPSEENAFGGIIHTNKPTFNRPILAVNKSPEKTHMARIEASVVAQSEKGSTAYLAELRRTGNKALADVACLGAHAYYQSNRCVDTLTDTVLSALLERRGSVSSIASALTLVKKALRLLGVDLEHVVQIRMHKSIYQSIGTESAKSRSKRHGVNSIVVRKAQEMINTVLEVMRSPDKHDPRDVFVALGLATGRRMSELLKTASFRRVGAKTYWVTFTGQLKLSKEEKQTLTGDLGSTIGYEIPVLAPAELIEPALAIVRANFPCDGLSVMESKRRWHDILSRRTIATLSRFADKRTLTGCHNLRHLYANLVYKILEAQNDDVGYTITGVLHKFLGHSTDASSTAYTIVRLMRPGELKPLGGRRIEPQERNDVVGLFTLD